MDVDKTLASGGSDQKLSTAVLKAWLKAQGMTQSGDKPTLWGRCKLRHRTTTLGLRTSDGDDPCSLNPAGLRKAAARAGLSPIGSNDELLIALVDHLAKSAPKAAAASSSSSSSDASSATGATSSTNSGASSGKLDPVALAEKVLSLADASVGDPILVLRLADLSLQASAPTAALRKAYLKLSLAIHPDRLSKSFPEATKAFQVLVTAFERATQPEGDGPGGDADDDAAMSGGRKGKGSKPATSKLARSNEGCVRTAVHCPRCKQPWSSSPLEGNPEWFYNVMMMGLKSFTCATCLCKFGCMSATHKCPSCKKAFEYNPSDYHRTVTCGNAKCQGKPFGFWLFHMSDRAYADLRVEIKASREAQAKVVEAAKRRTASARRRLGDQDDLQQQREEEAAFAAGLRDACPRCGLDIGLIGNDEEQRAHLASCADEKQHAAHAAKKAAAKAKSTAKAEKDSAQESAEALAAWQFMGAKNEQLWLLSEDQLAAQCKEKGVALPPSKGADKADYVAALVQSRALVKSSEPQGGGGSKRRGRFLDAASLPDNMEQLSVTELRAVLAGHGFVPTKGATKAQILAEVSAELCGDAEADAEKASAVPARLTAGGEEGEGSGKIEGKGSSSGKRARKAAVVEVDSDSDDSAFEPEED